VSTIVAFDPMLVDVDLAVVGVVLVKVLVIFAFLLVATMFMVWFERKVIAGMQNRVGPNKAGPWGILQTLADGIKAFFKEDVLPEKADKFVFKLAPYLAFVPAFLTFAIVPIGGDFVDGDGTVSLFGQTTRLQLADPPIGILFALAMSSLAVYGIMLAGWSSGSKYPLLGSVRASAQMVSYEASLGLSVATVVLVTGTLTTSGIVGSQAEGIADWNLLATGILPFVIFLISATAELNRPPFDLVEAEQELVGGYNTEYSGIRFALFFLAEFMNTVVMSGIIVTLFLGGPTPPVPGLEVPFVPGWLSGMIWFFLKVFVFLFAFVWFRATLPRLRYDQLMDLGWKVLIPLSFAWFLLVAAIQLGDVREWTAGNYAVVLGIGFAVLLLGYGLFRAAVRVSARNRELEGTVF
jgi:NADH-quinone oxidoreductase subunit H